MTLREDDNKADTPQIVTAGENESTSPKLTQKLTEQFTLKAKCAAELRQAFRDAKPQGNETIQQYLFRKRRFLNPAKRIEAEIRQSETTPPEPLSQPPPPDAQ